MITVQMQVSAGRARPGIGYHYYYFYPKIKRYRLSPHYITFEKKERKSQGGVSSGTPYYKLYIGISQDETFQLAMQNMFNSRQSNGMRVLLTLSVDTSSTSPSLLWTRQHCEEPRAHQTIAIQAIQKLYQESKLHNVKVLVHGERGTGKSYLGLCVVIELLRIGCVSVAQADC